MAINHTDFLGPVDNAFFAIDRPENPMNIGGILIFDGIIEYQDIVKLLNARLHQAPKYRQRVVEVPVNLGMPAWIDDPDFAVENHIYQLTLDAPGTDEQVRALAGNLISSMLDREKPLWEVYLIGGLENDRTCVFVKVHHCMADGLSAVELLTLLLDFTPETNLPQNPPEFAPPDIPSNTRLIFDSVRAGIPYRLNILRKLGEDAQMMFGRMLDRDKRKKTLFGLVSLLSDNLSFLRSIKSITGKNTGDTRVAWAELPLGDIKAISKKAGASVNDVMLTLYSTGVTRYLDSHNDDSDQDFLRIIIPVNMRSEDVEDTFGNRISMLPVDVLLEERELTKRLSAISAYTRIMKESNMSVGIDVGFTLPALVPAFLQPAVWAVVPTGFALLSHTWCTNVPGPQIPLYMLGKQLLHTRGFFPINPSMGMSAVIFSYNGTISVTVVSDAGIVDDVTEIRRHIYESYFELCESVGISPTLPDIPAEHQPIEVEVDEIVVSEVEVVEVDEPNSVSSQNGVSELAVVESSAVVVETDPAQNNGDAPAETPEKLEYFTEPWAFAFKDAINNNRDYYNASTKWKAGAISLVVKASPQHNIPRSRAVYLDLHQGVCRDARIMTVTEAKSKSSFVLEGDYDTWITLLQGDAQPLPMIMRGKLKLKKGSVLKLTPYTKSAQELVKSAQDI